MDYTIIIADDHPLFRTALKSSVSLALNDPMICEAGSIAELQTLLENNSSPDLILLDLHMPGAHGLSGLIFLRGQYPDVPVVVVSASDDLQIIQKTKKHGANGFIPKSTSLDDLKTAIINVLNGENWWPENFQPVESQESSDMEARLATLTPQQFRVLGMISEGMLNKQIAYDLNVSEATIKAHVTAIFKKLGVRSRTQAVIAIKALEIEIPGQNTQDQENPD
ncbi:response regulator transcription factor [Endozoicomonas sp. SCSIO W0465]|uniref:response regulator n=1 Tax=Endozoicomonas sp. SCSIO W0465 TaxID=2918516 RepID=UPI002075ADB9|nr:response regulator transcription factor [Endozoicomonas sp. SCSIO W0465]USE39036.1 response regulator transcription factor [Endozoicomonas sp. SCSIO W0465]